MSFLTGALGNVWAKIIAIGAIVIAVLAALSRVFSAGKTAAKAEGQAEQLSNVATRNSVDASVASSSDASNRDRLRSKWTRG